MRSSACDRWRPSAGLIASVVAELPLTSSPAGGFVLSVGSAWLTRVLPGVTPTDPLYGQCRAVAAASLRRVICLPPRAPTRDRARILNDGDVPHGARQHLPAVACEPVAMAIRRS
jgi:hypothetical protein